jgi:hypothetical protein
MESNLKNIDDYISIHLVKNPFHFNLPDMHIATYEKEKFNISSSGKGFSATDRLLSSYGEIVERTIMFSTKCAALASFNSKMNMVDPELMVPEYSVNSSVRIEWLEVASPGSDEKYYVHRPIRGSSVKKYYNHTSNGCAVGRSKQDSVRRAREEILERHNFLSLWYFQNLEVTEIKNTLKQEVFITSTGWEIYKFHIKSPYNKGTSCVLLINRSDKRFCKGGGIIGLSYGNSEKALKAALSECLQALEVNLYNGTIEKSLDYYLSNKLGGKYLLQVLRSSPERSINVQLGKEYYYTSTTHSQLPYYSEYFIENALPLQLKVGKYPRVYRFALNDLMTREGIPVPIG